jgi:DnaJ-domain-containing protein 1
MELIAIAFMLVSGVLIAVFVVAAHAIARGESGPAGRPAASPDRDRIAASLLFQLLALGETPADRALNVIRNQARLLSPVTRGVDVTSWAERYAQLASREQCLALLSAAVRSLAGEHRIVPPQQYSALLDLCFALGFQTDALFRLREAFPFEYVDHAKHARPRSADRGGGQAPLYARDAAGDQQKLLSVLEIEGKATRQEIIAAYRRLAARHHPDRFFEAAPEVQADAAARFIEITTAYERLLAVYAEE